MGPVRGQVLILRTAILVWARMPPAVISSRSRRSIFLAPGVRSHGLMVRSFRRNGRKQHRTGPSRKRHDPLDRQGMLYIRERGARRQSGNTVIASFTLAASRAGQRVSHDRRAQAGSALKRTRCVRVGTPAARTINRRHAMHSKKHRIPGANRATSASGWTAH